MSDSGLTPIIRFMNDAKQRIQRLETKEGQKTTKSTPLTIASGAITVDYREYYTLVPESSFYDYVDTINGGSDGYFLTLATQNTGDTITIQNGIGNIYINGDCTLSSPVQTLTLRYNKTLLKWLEIARSQSSGGGGGGGGDVSAVVAAAIAAHAGQPDVHHAKLHGIDSITDHSAVGEQYAVVGLSAANVLDVLNTTIDGHTDPNTILRSSGTGGLALTTLSTYNLTSPDSILINPFDRVNIQAGVDFRTSDSITGFLGSGWRIENHDGNSFMDIRRIQVEELHAYAFVADIERVRVGETFVTQSMAILKDDFVVPAVDGSVVIRVENVPQFPGQVFMDNEFVLMQIVDRSGGGLTIARAWGQVSGYVDNADGTQSWTYTHRYDGFTVGMTFKAGSYVLDFGQSGDGYIHESVIDLGGSPYLRMATWTIDPWTPAHREIRVQLGNLNSITDLLLNPTGYGLYSTNVFLSGRIIIRSGSSGISEFDDANQDNIADGSTYARVKSTDISAGHIVLDSTVDGEYGKVKQVILDAGYIQVGSGDKDSTLNGWNFQEDEIVGQAAGVDQVVMGTDGRIKAGQNSIMLGYYGLDLVAYQGTNPNPTDNVKAIAFWDSLASASGSNRPAGRLWGAYDVGGQYGWQMEAFHSSHLADYPKMWLTVDGGSHLRWFVLTDLDIISLSSTTISILGDVTISGLTTASNHMIPDLSSTRDLGSASKAWRKIYADELVVGTITGGTQLTGQIWQFDTTDMYVRSNSASARTLYVANPGAGTMHLDVEGNIYVGGLVDNVDVANLSADYGTHVINANAHHAQVHVLATTAGLGADHTVSGLTSGQVLMATGATTAVFTQLPHSALSGLGADDHPQYLTQARGDARYLQLTGGNLTGFLGISTGTSAAFTLTNSNNVYTFALSRSDLGNSARLRNGGGFVEFETAPKVGANLIWHAGNDGAGSGLDADVIDGIDSPQIVVTNVGRLISAQHSFSPAIAQAPFILGGNAYNQVVTGFMADTLNKSVSTNSTLTGGGFLTSSLTLGVSLTNAFTWNANHTWATGRSINLVNGDIQAGGIAWLLSTRRVRGISGTNAAPTFSFGTDTNTGLYSGGTGILAITCAGADVMQFTSSRINPASTGSIDIGDYNRKWRTLFVTELYAETLVAQSVMATIGGRIAVAPTSELIAPVTKITTYIDSKYNSFQIGDFIFFQASPGGVPQIEAMKITEAPITITGGYRYNTLRAVNVAAATVLIATLNAETWIDVADATLVNGDTVYVTLGDISEIMTVTSDVFIIDGGYRYNVTRYVNGFSFSGLPPGYGVFRISHTWEKGDAFISLGHTTGQGYIDLTSTSTIMNHLGPTMTIYSRTGVANWNDLVATVAIGNLRSFVDYTGDTFGWAVGNNLTLTPAGGFSGLTGDATNGLRLFNVALALYNGGNTFLTLDYANGLNILIGTDDVADRSAITFHDGSNNVYAYLKSFLNAGSGFTATILTNRGVVAGDSSLFLSSFSQAGYYASVHILAQRSTSQAYVHLQADGTTDTSAFVDITTSGYVNIEAMNGQLMRLRADRIALLSESGTGIFITKVWNSYPDSINYSSEISNDNNFFKQLMVVGNKSDGSGIRRVGIWDQLQIGGAGFNEVLNVNGRIFLVDLPGTPSVPVGGGVLYCEFGALKYRGPFGTITTLAPA